MSSNTTANYNQYFDIKKSFFTGFQLLHEAHACPVVLLSLSMKTTLLPSVDGTCSVGSGGICALAKCGLTPGSLATNHTDEWGEAGDTRCLPVQDNNKQDIPTWIQDDLLH